MQFARNDSNRGVFLTAVKPIATILRDAKALISDERNWTRGTPAVDRDGASVQADAPEACGWDVCGAVIRHSGSQAAFGFLRSVSLELFDREPDEANDALGHAAMMELFDSAIAFAERDSATERSFDLDAPDPEGWRYESARRTADRARK